MTNPARDDSSKGDATSGGERLALWVALAGLLAFLAIQAFTVTGRFLDPDEGEHLTVVAAQQAGQVLYRDLFEHHGPLYYALLGAVVDADGDPEDTIARGRWLSFGLWLLTLGLVGRWAGGRSGTSRRRYLAAALAGLLLASDAYTVSSLLEIRPEALLLPLLFGSLLLMLRAFEHDSRVRMVGAGLLMGLALVTGPRTLFVGLAVLAIHLMRLALIDPIRRREALIEMALFGGACLVAPAVTAMVFASRDGLAALVEGYVTFNLTLKYSIEIPVWNNLRETWLANPELWVAGACGLLMAIRTERTRAAHWSDRALHVLLFTGVASLFVIQFASMQHFATLIAPFLALLVARRWLGADADETWWPRAWPVLVSLLVAVAAIAAIFFRPRFLPTFETRFVAPVLIVPLHIASLAGVIACVAVRRPRWSLALLVLQLTWAPLLAQFQTAQDVRDNGRFSNQSQVSAIRALNAAVPDHGRIMSGHNGLAFTRLPFGPHFMLHDQAVDMYGRAKMRMDLERRMRQEMPAAVLVDYYLEYLYRNPWSREVRRLAPWHVTPEDDLWRLLAPYRLLTRVRDQMAFPLGWMLDVDMWVLDPVARVLPAEDPDPAWRAHAAADGRRVLFDPSPPTGRTWRVAVELEASLASGRIMPVLDWRSSDDGRCSAAGRWNWHCMGADPGVGRNALVCRYRHSWEDLERHSSCRRATSSPFGWVSAQGACVPAHRTRVTGRLVRRAGDQQLLAVFDLPSLDPGTCVAFVVELGNEAGTHVVRAEERDFTATIVP